ncbi:MAG: TraB/GumN family protein [Allosphingosinicella sp.]
MLNFSRRAWLLPLVAFALQPAAAAWAEPGKAAHSTPAKSAPKAADAKDAAPKPVVQDYRPRPALWLLADADTKIYLFGTIHMLPPGFRWRSEALDRTIEEADELVVETYDDGDDYMGAMAALLRKEPKPLLERVPEGRRAALQEAVDASGFPLSTFDYMQTWAAAMFLGISALLESYGADDPDDAPGVEDVLEAVFLEAGKPIGSIEDPMTVVASLNALPEEAQVSLLIGKEADGGDGKSSTEDELAAHDKDIHLWAQGKPETLADDLTGEMPPALYEALVTRRNAAWIDWLEARLERPGTLLLAVGAGHLAGPDSVQAMLKARGLEAKRID